MCMLYKNHFLKIAFFVLLTGISSSVFSSAHEEEDDTLQPLNVFMRQNVPFIKLLDLSLEPLCASTASGEVSDEHKEKFGIYLSARARAELQPLDVAPIKREGIPVLSLTCPSELSVQSVAEGSNAISTSCPEASHVPVISSSEGEDTKKSRRRSISTKKSRKKSSITLPVPGEEVPVPAMSLSEDPKTTGKASTSKRRHRARSEITHLHGRGGPNKFAFHNMKTPSFERCDAVSSRMMEGLLLKLAQSPLNSAESGMRALSIQDTGLFFSASRLARSEGEISPRCTARAAFLKTPFKGVESLTLQGLMCEHSLSFYLDLFPNLSEVIVASCRHVEYARATHMPSPSECIFKGLTQIATYVNQQTGDIRLQAFSLPSKVEVSKDEVSEALKKAGLSGFEFMGSQSHKLDGALRPLYMFRKS